MSSKPRMCFVQDDDSHWYCILADRKADFEDMAAEVSEDVDNNFDVEFGEYRLEMHPSNYSFVDLKEIPSDAS